MILDKRKSETQSESSAFSWDSLIHSSNKHIVIQRPEGFRFSKHIINFQTEFLGETIVATGEAETENVAIAKARSELVERVAFFKWAETHCDVQNTNGWAAHTNPASARINAILELCERDALLRHWVNQQALAEVEFESLPLAIREWAGSELSISELPHLKIFVTSLGYAPTVVCALTNSEGYGVTGHSSSETIAAALEGAITEACRAAHHMLRRSYWADSIALRDKNLSRIIQPGAHSVYYAYVEPLPLWMSGGKITFDEASQTWCEYFQNQFAAGLVHFSFTSVLEGPITVGFATHADCFDLAWGNLDGLWMGRGRQFKKFKSINLKPHIVA